jgi:soluble lytic murein transglycosylase-like protein
MNPLFGRSAFKPRLLLVAVLSCLLLPAAAAATIYRYVDENGVMHFTNTPLDKRYQPMWGAPSKRPRSAAGDYDQYIQTSALQFRVDPLLVKAVIKTESYFDCQAVSKKGAMGLMQLMPDTARDLRVSNPFNPEENIRGGTQYLRMMLDLFNGDLQLALAAYNAGPTRVQSLGRVPRIPETMQYIERVMLHYRQYQAASPHKKWLYVAYD